MDLKEKEEEMKNMPHYSMSRFGFLSRYSAGCWVEGLAKGEQGWKNSSLDKWSPSRR